MGDVCVAVIILCEAAEETIEIVAAGRGGREGKREEEGVLFLELFKNLEIGLGIVLGEFWVFWHFFSYLLKVGMK